MYKRQAQAHIDVSEYIRAMGPRLANVHLCGYRDTGMEVKPCLPFQGEEDLVKLKQELVASGYHGPVLLEVYGNNYRDLSELGEVFDHINTLFSSDNGTEPAASV